MSEYIHLIGAERVGEAGHNIKAAAETIRQAASELNEVFAQHQRFMNEWLERIETILTNKS